MLRIIPPLVFGLLGGFLSGPEVYASSETPRPIILLIEDGKISDIGASSSRLARDLDSLERNFKIRLDQRMIHGYFEDRDYAKSAKILNPGEPNGGFTSSYDGFDLMGKLKGTPLDQVHKPAPEAFNDPAATAIYDAIDSEWNALIKSRSGRSLEPFRKTSQSFASPIILSAYIASADGDTSVYFNRETQTATSTRLESVLHEAIHVWHFKNPKEVSKLLRSPGSYFDRRRTLEKKYPKLDPNRPGPVYNPADPKSVEDYRLKFGQMQDELRWPKRYGPGTNRALASPNSCPVSSTGVSEKKVAIESGSLTFCLEDDKMVGDTHSMTNSLEYFAVLMQLKVFNPAEFARVATDLEKEFAEKFWANYKASERPASKTTGGKVGR
jgi:hypothetical protein